MNKRMNIEMYLSLFLFILGWIIGNEWQVTKFSLDLTFNIVDVITLIATIVMGVYIVRILEKEVQDRRIEKDMYLSKISSIENILEDIEELFQNKNGSDIDYRSIVSQEHRIRTKKNSIFKHLLEKSDGKIKDKLQKFETQLKCEFKDLRQYLTQTSVGNIEPKEIEISNNKATYSSERTACILSSLNNIDNQLLELKVLVNKM